jgi:hypothetical protein
MSVFRCNYDFDEEILKDLVQYEDMLNAKNVCVDVYCFSCRNAGGTFGQLLGQIKKKVATTAMDLRRSVEITSDQSTPGRVRAYKE